MDYPLTAFLPLDQSTGTGTILSMYRAYVRMYVRDGNHKKHHPTIKIDQDTYISINIDMYIRT